MHCGGSGGHSGSRSFLCMNVLNSFIVNLFVGSVLVVGPNGIEVRVLSVDGR